MRRSTGVRIGACGPALHDLDEDGALCEPHLDVSRDRVEEDVPVTQLPRILEKRIGPQAFERRFRDRQGKVRSRIVPSALTVCGGRGGERDDAGEGRKEDRAGPRRGPLHEEGYTTPRHPEPRATRIAMWSHLLGSPHPITSWI